MKNTMTAASPVFDSIARAVRWSGDNNGSPATVRCFSRLASVAKWLVEEVLYYTDKGTDIEISQTKERLTVSGWSNGYRFTVLIVQS